MALFCVREWLNNPVPFKNSVEPLDSIKGEFFHLGGLLGKVFDFGPKKEGGLWPIDVLYAKQS